MITELKERTLQGVLAGKYDDNSIQHVINKYRQRFGMTGISHEGTDRMAVNVSDMEYQEVEKKIEQDLDILDLADSFVNDVNQPTGDFRTLRRIDRDGFGVWAGTHDAISHRVYIDHYTEEQIEELFNGKKPAEEDKYHPFIYRALAIEILHEVICKEPA